MKFSRGYSRVRDDVSVRSRIFRCCDNCRFFYQDKGDTEEVCQNQEVLEYDIAVEGNRVFCGFWKAMKDR